MKVSPAAVLNDYSRARVIEMVNICFVQAVAALVRTEPMFGPRPSRRARCGCPRHPDERARRPGARALEELAEGERVDGNPLPGYHLEQLREEEAEPCFGHRLDQPRPAADTDVGATDRWLPCMALARGLRQSLADSGLG